MIRFLKRKKSDHPSAHPPKTNGPGYPNSLSSLSHSSSQSNSDLPAPTPLYAKFARTASGTDLSAITKVLDEPYGNGYGNGNMYGPAGGRRERKRSKVLPPPPPPVPEERPSLTRQISSQYATSPFVHGSTQPGLVSPPDSAEEHSHSHHAQSQPQPQPHTPGHINPSPRTDSLQAFSAAHTPISATSTASGSSLRPRVRQQKQASQSTDDLSSLPPRSALYPHSPHSPSSNAYPKQAYYPSPAPPPTQPLPAPPQAQPTPLTPPSSPPKRSSFIFISGGKVSNPPSAYAGLGAPGSVPGPGKDGLTNGKRDPSPGWVSEEASPVEREVGKERDGGREPRKLRKKPSRANSDTSSTFPSRPSLSLGSTPGIVSKRVFPAPAPPSSTPSAYRAPAPTLAQHARGQSASRAPSDAGSSASREDRPREHARGQSVSAALPSPTYKDAKDGREPAHAYHEVRQFDPRRGSTYVDIALPTRDTNTEWASTSAGMAGIGASGGTHQHTWSPIQQPVPPSPVSQEPHSAHGSDVSRARNVLSQRDTMAPLASPSPAPSPGIAGIGSSRGLSLPSPNSPGQWARASPGLSVGGGSAQSTPLSGMYVGRSEGSGSVGGGGSGRGGAEVGVFEAAQRGVMLDGLVPMERAGGYRNGNGNGNGHPGSFEQGQRSMTLDTFQRQGSTTRVNELRSPGVTKPSSTNGIYEVRAKEVHGRALPAPAPPPNARRTPSPAARTRASDASDKSDAEIYGTPEGQDARLEKSSSALRRGAGVKRHSYASTDSADAPPPTWRAQEAEKALSPSASTLRRSGAKRLSIQERDGEGRPSRTGSVGGESEGRSESVGPAPSVANSSTTGSNGASSSTAAQSTPPSSLTSPAAVTTPPRKRHDAGAGTPTGPLIPFPHTPTKGHSHRPSDPRYKLPAPRAVPSVTASTRTASPPPAPPEEAVHGSPFVQFLLRPALLAELLPYISYRDFATLQSLSRTSRTALHDTRALREEALERFLHTVGYRRWPRAQQKKKDEPLTLSLRDLNAYLMGVSIATHQYASAAEAFLASSSRDVGSVVRVLAGAARAFTRVVLRLRAQAESEWDGGAFQSPLFRLGHAPLLRVFVPSPAGAWLNDDSVVECEKELRRAGVMSLMRRGDVVWDAAVSDEGNIGRLIWDGNYLLDLEYDYSKWGQLPHYFNSIAVSPYYWHKVIRTTLNPIAHIDLRPYAREVLQNIELTQERVQAETPQGGYHTIIGYVHRTFAHITGGAPIPETKEVVSRAWEGKLVIEFEGTNEGVADLQARCGRGGGKGVYRILRERSRPGEVWVRVVTQKERVL